VKRLLIALLLSTSAAAHAQSLSKALVVPTCAQGRELEQAGPGLQQLTMDTQGRLCAAATNAGSTNMVTPVMFNGQVAPATLAYAGLFTGTWNAALAFRQMPSPIPGTFSNFHVLSPTAVAVGQYTFGLVVNGVLTPLQCSIGQGGTNLGTTTQCSDNTDTFDVYANDFLAYGSVPAGTPTALVGYMAISSLFTSANGQESLVGAVTGGFLGTGSISYLGPNSGTPVTTDLAASVVIPTAGILDHLNVYITGNQPATGSVQITVLKNGVPTGIVATCTNTSNLRCNDLTHALSVSAKDTISIQLCPSNIAGCPAGGNAQASTTLQYSMRWQPTVLHQALLLSIGVTNSPTTNYLSVSGNYTAVSTSPTALQNISPAAMTLGDLLVAQCAPTSAAVGRTSTLRANGVIQAPTVIIPTGGAVCPTMDIEQDTTDTYQASADDLLILGTVPIAGGGNTASPFKTSMTATVP
jgi:hypothetical protein